MRNMVNVAVKAARNDYVKTQLDTHQKDPKKFWKNINDIQQLIPFSNLLLSYNTTKIIN